MSPRVKKAHDLVAKQQHRLEEAKLDALRAMDDVRRAIDGRGVSLRRLALRAARAERFVSILWSEASWTATHRRDLARARAGKQRGLSPGWSHKDVARYAQQKPRA